MQPPSGRSSRARSHQRVSPYPVRGNVVRHGPSDDQETPGTVFAAEQAACGFAQALRAAAGAESQADCVGQQRVSAGFFQDLRAPVGAEHQVDQVIRVRTAAGLTPDIPVTAGARSELGQVVIERVAAGGATPDMQAAYGAGRSEERAVQERVAAGGVGPDLPVAAGADLSEGQAVPDRVGAGGTTLDLQPAAGATETMNLTAQASPRRASAPTTTQADAVLVQQLYQLLVQPIVKETVNQRDTSGNALAPAVMSGGSFNEIVHKLWEAYAPRVKPEQ